MVIELVLPRFLIALWAVARRSNRATAPT